MGIPLDTCSGVILFSIASITYYIRIQTTLPFKRGVLGIAISNLERNQPLRAKNGTFYTPAVKLKMAEGYGGLERTEVRAKKFRKSQSKV